MCRAAWVRVPISFVLADEPSPKILSIQSCDPSRSIGDAR